MTDGFQRRRGGGAVATLHAFEADVLRSLAAQLIELLRNEKAVPTSGGDPLEELMDFNGPTTAPDDPVLARLLPAAYRDDAEAAADFRRFTESELRDGKAACAAAVIDTLEDAGLPVEIDDTSIRIDVELDREAALSWLKALTDLRLALAARLGVTEEDELGVLDGPSPDQQPVQDPNPGDELPENPVREIYDWLGYVQETLVRAMGH